MPTLTRFYEKKPIDSAAVRAIREILTGKFNWGLSSGAYSVYYPGQFYSVDSMNEVDEVVTRKGQPDDLVVYLTSGGGRKLNFDTREVPGCVSRGMSFYIDNRSEPPEKILDAIETTLSLTLVSELMPAAGVRSVFIAHAFDAKGQQYANELARFLALLEIRCQSGRAFAPDRVSDKVLNRLARHDAMMAIVTPQENTTWLSQEMATAKAMGKQIFVLKEQDAALTAGILGDHEYIPFEVGQLSAAFIPILEGLAEIKENQARARAQTAGTPSPD